jgi:hypothetical protein
MFEERCDGCAPARPAPPLGPYPYERLRCWIGEEPVSAAEAPQQRLSARRIM